MKLTLFNHSNAERNQLGCRTTSAGRCPMKSAIWFALVAYGITYANYEPCHYLTANVCFINLSFKELFPTNTSYLLFSISQLLVATL